MNEKRSGRTHSAIDTKPVPRLPHERDESSDSQIDDEVRPIMRQAHDDVVAGRVDTDRGVPMQEAYQRQKEARAPTPKKRRGA